MSLLFIPRIYAAWCSLILAFLLTNEIVGWTPSILFASWHHHTNSPSPRWWLQIHSIIALLLEINTILLIFTYSSKTRTCPRYLIMFWELSAAVFIILIYINFWNFGPLPFVLAASANFGLLVALAHFAKRVLESFNINAIFGFLCVLSLDNYFRLAKFCTEVKNL